jgi:hypothetical protein
VRIAVSAANQKRQALRALPESSPLKQRFLIDRASSVILPHGLDTVTQTITGGSLLDSPLSLQFAQNLIGVLRTTLQQAGQDANLDLRLECPALTPLDCDHAAQKKHLETEGQLHASAGAGIAAVAGAPDADDVVALLQHALDATTIARLRMQRASAVQQGVLSIV